MKKTKKGFTIVELIIVIAVIAVLTAILVPTFIHLTKKANEAADHSLVTNLNKALAMREAEEGDKGKNNTMYDCVMDLEQEGYKLPQLATRSDEDLVWSRLQNRFFLSKEHDNSKEAIEKYGEKYDCWHIYEQMPGTQEWAIYPNEDTWNNATATKTAAETEIVTGLEVGFDSGKAKISSVKYESDQKRHVVIRTDGGNLTVDASKATVDHYAVVQVVDLQAIAGKTYNEYGTVIEKLKVANGHVVVKETGEVPNVEITSSSNPIDIETNGDIVVSVASTVDASSLSNVTIEATGENPEVVIDEKIPATSVTVNGSTASESTVTKIKKVSSYGDLVSVVNAKTEKYIMLANDITTTDSLVNVLYSTTIDGNGFKMSGDGGLRVSGKNPVRNFICVGNGATTDIDEVTVKNVVIESTVCNRPIETRGHIKALNLYNVKAASTPSNGNPQGITIGGNQDSLLKLNISNCDLLVSNSGYVLISFNPLDLRVTDSTLTGWAGLYFKGPNSSHGTRDSKIYVENTDFICHNVHYGVSNSFGAVVFEDSRVEATIVDCNLDVTEESDQTQTAILFNTSYAVGKVLTDCKVTIKGDTLINGEINFEDIDYDPSNVLSIEGGKFVIDPTPYLAPGKTVTKEGMLFIVK